MPYTDTIERLAKIVDHLALIGQMTKGEPLRSDDWNKLVSAVNDLAQIAIVREKGGEASQEGQFAPAKHEHIGQVDSSWFDPATQSLIDKQGGAPETAAELKKLSSAMGELRKITTTLQAQMKALLLRMDALDDGGRSWDGRLGRLELKVEATHDLRPELTRMDGRFTALNEKLAQALELKNQLVDHAGRPIILPDVVQRLEGMEDLRENLKGPDGQVVRYRDFDARLGTLEETLITRENLDGMIFERLQSGGILEDLSGGLLEIVKTDSASRFAELGGKLTGVESGLIDVGLRVDKYGGSLDKLSGRVSLAETQLGRVGAIETKIGDLGLRTNGVEATVQQHSNTLSGLKELPLELARLDSRLQLIEPLTKNVFAIEQSLSLFDSRLFALDGFDSRLRTVEGLSTQIAVTTERVSTLETSLSLVKTDFTNLQLSASTFDGRLSSVEGLSSQLATTTQRVGTLETQIKVATADFGKISTSVSTFDTRLAGVEGLSVTTTQRIGTMETQLKVASADTGKLQTSISNVSTRLSTVEALSPQLASTNQRVGTLETQLSVATTDVSRLQTKLTAATTDFTRLESRVKKFEMTRPLTGPTGFPR